MKKHQRHIRFDWAVKKMLRSKANFGILEGFISELLKEDVKIHEIVESEGKKETTWNELNCLAILVKDLRGQPILVEIRNIREYDYFYKILYNTAKAITEHMDSGMVYSNVKKVITVSVVYFDLGQGKDYVYHGDNTFIGIHNHDTLELTGRQQKVFELPVLISISQNQFIIKINDFNDAICNGLDQWVYYLKNHDIPDEYEARGIAEAREKLKEINLSERERAVYLDFIEEFRYEAGVAATIRFDLEWAKNEGLEQGRELGRQKEKRSMARQLKNKGLLQTP